MNKKIYFVELNKGEEKYISNKNLNAEYFYEPVSEKNVEQISDAEIISAMVHSDFSESVLKKLPNLKMIALRSVGYNNVDLRFCAEQGIVVSHVPDYGSHAIAEHVFALLLSSIRNIEVAEENVENGIFDEKGLCGETLKGKTIGIIGTGKIGAHVCRIASLGFGMNVLAFDVHQNLELAEKYNFKYVELDEIYKQSHVISLHAPLFPSTTHMINKKSLLKMNDGTILINTSRGKLICTEDLVAALKSGKIAKALLDVIENENNLKKDRELIHMDNVIVTPHIAYYTHETVENMYTGSIESISEYLNNKKIKNQIFGN
ncbi:MAG: hydroxyacid dehydrogenase [Candidatus Pacebacteria bacterium]|nr:hydroxyacid dehydrogenase [Candidatus Paceibacterota bacterium]